VSASESPLPTLRFLSVAADRVKHQALAFRCILHPDSVGVQQGLQACVPVAPWVKTGYEPCAELTHGQIALLALSLQK
jgi:hypothetical protein